MHAFSAEPVVYQPILGKTDYLVSVSGRGPSRQVALPPDGAAIANFREQAPGSGSDADDLRLADLRSVPRFARRCAVSARRFG
jgi:hypothetical protein